jgi:phage terminase small subunit
LKGRPKTWDQKRRGLNPATAVPVTILTKVPKCPKGFSKEMRETWKQTGEDLIVMGCFTTQSRIPLESYCYSVANMRKTMRDTKAKTTTKTAAVKECRIAAETLGLTPAAHSKMRRPTSSTPVDSADDQTFAEIVN